MNSPACPCASRSSWRTPLPRRMTPWHVSVAAAVVLAFAAPGGAVIDVFRGEAGELSLSGFLRVQADIHTGPQNPNLSVLGRENNAIQLFRQWSLLDATWKTPLEGLKFFVRSRFWIDSTAAVGANVPRYDAFPT